jgi:hypothetical protein
MWPGVAGRVSANDVFLCQNPLVHHNHNQAAALQEIDAI